MPKTCKPQIKLNMVLSFLKKENGESLFILLYANKLVLSKNLKSQAGFPITVFIIIEKVIRLTKNIKCFGWPC